MSSYETQEKNPPLTEQLLALLKKMEQEGDFHLEEGETPADVIERCELLTSVIQKLDRFGPHVIQEYRTILEQHGITREQTGKLSLVVVGGRVHGESQLKTWSDIDTITLEYGLTYDEVRQFMRTHQSAKTYTRWRERIERRNKTKSKHRELSNIQSSHQKQSV
jgi:uncharacterized protein (TIGR03643 family)